MVYIGYSEENLGGSPVPLIPVPSLFLHPHFTFHSRTLSLPLEVGSLYFN